MQRDSIRRGVESGVQFSRFLTSRQGREARAQSADHCGSSAAHATRLGDPVAARGLAVGPRHAHRPQFLRGTPVDFVRKKTGEPAQIPDPDVGHAPSVVPFEAFAFPQNGGGAALERARNEVAPVVARPWVGEKHFPRGQSPAVHGKVRHARPLRSESLPDVFDLISHT